MEDLAGQWLKVEFGKNISLLQMLSHGAGPAELSGSSEGINY